MQMGDYSGIGEIMNHRKKEGNDQRKQCFYDEVLKCRIAS